MFVGYNRIGVNTSSDLKAGSWADGTICSAVVGNWAPGQPKPADGDCAAMTVNDKGCYTWTLKPCNIKMAFVCKTKACVQGKY